MKQWITKKEFEREFGIIDSNHYREKYSFTAEGFKEKYPTIYDAKHAEKMKGLASCWYGGQKTELDGSLYYYERYDLNLANYILRKFPMNYYDEGSEIAECQKLIFVLEEKVAKSEKILKDIKDTIMIGKDFEKLINLVQSVNEIQEKWNEYTMVLRLTGYDKDKNDNSPKLGVWNPPYNGNFVSVATGPQSSLSSKEYKKAEKPIQDYMDMISDLNTKSRKLRDEISEYLGDIYLHDSPIPCAYTKNVLAYGKMQKCRQHFEILMGPVFEHDMVQEKWDELMVLLRKHGYNGIDGYNLQIS